ncbi:hypothetical protein J2T09_001394 [Neorhizobium huautlense]|uniref:SMODS and SLOG-associating 2TM effector domain-containing protein n=1 Tax=Neorhizobium huautlense TaxID=67774 RepID=A0ABT9PSE0_9HYPH|nr:hypothetical protein [Neorhizobium huautlense]MDP9836649.1 hypothetical protein [Neorhizobium huautlense]
MSFLVIAFGASAAADIAAVLEWSNWAKYAGMTAALIGALQLVFDFSGKARDHQSLQRDYYYLLAEIEEYPNADDERLAVWQAKMTRIAGDEPPTLRALDAKAYNDALSGLGTFELEKRIVIPWHHRLLGQVWAFEGYDYKLVCEVQPKRRPFSSSSS